MGLVARVSNARLLHPTGGSRPAGLADGVAAVNAVAGHAPGSVVRRASAVSRPEPCGSFQAIDAVDPPGGASVSVWKAPESARHFCHRTVQGALLRKRARGAETMSGPDNFIWSVRCDVRLSLAKESIADLVADGPSARAHDFKRPDSQAAAS